MKVAAFFHGSLIKNKYIALLPTDMRDWPAIKKMFASKEAREGRTHREILLKCEIDAAFQHRTFKQNNAVWALVTVIFQSMEENERLPTNDEKYDLYCDLLEEYAEKTPTRIGDRLRPVHISRANTRQAAYFIDGLMYHLCSQCQLSQDLEATVREVLYEWEIWRGKQEDDINDTRTIREMRERVIYSEASGRGNHVDFHHIVSRGAAPDCVDCAWNILALTHEEHMYFHDHGWGMFLEKYPHLRGRVEKAFRKALHLPIPSDFHTIQHIHTTEFDTI